MPEKVPEKFQPAAEVHRSFRTEILVSGPQGMENDRENLISGSMRQ